jgi:hypothetical protein
MPFLNTLPLLLTLLSFVVTGCTATSTSNTARTAKEQMLLSNAVDQSLDKIDFTPIYGQNVFIEEKYLECVDKNYVIGSVRHRVLKAGGVIAPAADSADVVMEIRSGGVGTDTSDSYVGIPEITLPGMLTLPEVRLTQRKSQLGYSKLGLVLYDAKTNSVLGDGGLSLAQSTDSNWYAFGMNVWQGGTLQKDVETAQRIPHGMRTNRLPTQVAFDAPAGRAPDSVRFASDAEEATE